MSNISDNIIVTTWDFKIPLVSPFLTQGYFGKFGVDTVAARNCQGKIYIPASLVKGVFRSVLRDLEKSSKEDINIIPEIFKDATDWLGAGSDENENDEDTNMPQRGKANFSDLIICNDVKNTEVLYRIEVDDFTGAVRQGAYQVIELTHPVGETVTFEGLVRFQGTKGQADVFAAALKKSLSLVPAIGAFKSVGFGRIDHKQGISLMLVTKAYSQQGKTPLGSFDKHGNISVRMSFDRSILISAERISDNLFSGAVILPGSVLKGALAEKIAAMGRYDEFSELLSAMRFSHAYPVSKGKESEIGMKLPLPLSLYITQKNKNKYGDYFSGSGQENLPLSDELIFQNDWKGETYTDINHRLNTIAGPEFEMRTRTKIKHDTQIAYDDDDGGKLFSYQSVLTNKHDWVCGLYLDPENTFPDTLKIEFLGILSDHIFQMGKTKAYCHITLFNQTANGENYPPGGNVTITLVSDALILAMSDVRGDQNIELSYAKYFKTLGLELIDFMASQKMSGGYLGMRYGENGQYEPWLLTERGAVFHLKIGDEGDLNKLINEGLPVPDSISSDWRKTPYIPQNGYGEIAVNINEELLLKLNAEGV